MLVSDFGVITALRVRRGLSAHSLSACETRIIERALARAGSGAGRPHDNRILAPDLTLENGKLALL